MEEKNEQLRLTNSRLKVLKKSTGQSIIDYFQTNDLKSEAENQLIDDFWFSGDSIDMEDDDVQIEQILMEANAYGLRPEVKHYAERLFQKNPLSSRVDAYVRAYHELIKD